MESEEHPQSLFWLNRAWSMIGKQNHFPLCVKYEAIFYDTRMETSRLREIQPSLMAFFSNYQDLGLKYLPLQAQIL
jgi:hypothetical protein